MDDVNTLIQCLSGSLTLLVKSGVLQEDNTNRVIQSQGYEGLFNLLNEKFFEYENHNGVSD